MNKVKNFFIYLTLLITFFILFKYNCVLKYSVIDATNIWLTKVFPTLFIMFILNNIIINFNVLDNLNKLINPLFNKLFKTTGNSSSAFILSIFSGTPSSAFIIKELYKSKQITINDANKLLSFTYFSNPLFLYSILSLSFNKFIVFKIILIHYLTNIIIGLTERNKFNNIEYIEPSKCENKIDISIIPRAINKSFNTMLMILGTIITFMIITNLITTIFRFNVFFTIILKGIMEITQSLNILNTLQGLSIIKEILAIAIISFGGFSIHMQIISIINDTDILYKYFFYGRLKHVLFSTITYLLCYMAIGAIN